MTDGLLPFLDPHPALQSSQNTPMMSILFTNPFTLALPLPHALPGLNQSLHLHITLLGPDAPPSSSESSSIASTINGPSPRNAVSAALHPAYPSPKTILLFVSGSSSSSTNTDSVTTALGGLHPGGCPLGSLVYALPAVCHPSLHPYRHVTPALAHDENKTLTVAT